MAASRAESEAYEDCQEIVKLLRSCRSVHIYFKLEISIAMAEVAGRAVTC